MNFIELSHSLKYSEDFAFFLNRKPGIMFLIGLGKKSYNLHSNKFDFNDKAITNAIIAFLLIIFKK